MRSALIILYMIRRLGSIIVHGGQRTSCEVFYAAGNWERMVEKQRLGPD